MRLPTRRKVEQLKKKKEAEIKKSETKKRKEAWQEILCNGYKTCKIPKQNTITLKMKNLTCGIVAWYTIESVEISSEKILVNISWDELILVMISCLMEKYTEHFESVMCARDIHNVTVSKIPSSKLGTKQKIYKIKDTDTYVTIYGDIQDRLETIAKLMIAGGFNTDDIQFKLRRVEETEESTFWMDGMEEVTEEIEGAHLFQMMLSNNA